MFWEALEASGGGGGRLKSDKFLKVCVEGEGARQGARPQRPISPLFPQEVEQSPSFSLSMAENMICAEGEDPLPSTAIASPIVYLTAS